MTGWRRGPTGLAGSDIKLPLPLEKSRRLQNCVGREMEFGIRPEHIYEGNGNDNQSNALTAVVDVVEPMGADTIVICSIGGTEALARASATFAKAVGESLTLHFDIEKAHVLDVSSGEVVA